MKHDKCGGNLHVIRISATAKGKTRDIPIGSYLFCDKCIKVVGMKQKDLG